MEVATLPVMHDGYRLPLAAMQQLTAHVRGGGRVEGIAITRFEDNRLMLRDGLHRATAVMLARGALLDGEYVIEDMKYDMFLAPALAAGLYAPFDPRVEVRIADFSAYRDEVKRRSGADALAYIAAHRRDYVRPRRPCHDALARFYAECGSYGAELVA